MAKKRSKASYRAAALKGARTRKRNTPKTQRTRATAKPSRRRRRTTKKGSGLSELWNPKMAAASGKTILSGIGGGVSYRVVEKVLASQSQEMQMIVGGVLSFVTAAVFKAPNVAAGMAGAVTMRGMEYSGLLADNNDMNLQDHAYAHEIDRLPAVLNENGMYLEEESMYLEENNVYLQDEDLNADDYNVGYYEAGFGSGQGQW